MFPNALVFVKAATGIMWSLKDSQLQHQTPKADMPSVFILAKATSCNTEVMHSLCHAVLLVLWLVVSSPTQMTHVLFPESVPLV